MNYIKEAVDGIDKSIDNLEKRIAEIENEDWKVRYGELIKALIDIKDILITYKDYQVEFEIKDD